ncbi:MAG: Asp23/Gls24 family envelope stress response protein [Erysipelothrix sp.]|nr:Asp23/Gls24 family envelope stress response protein [Erysipelothrix sp.]
MSSNYIEILNNSEINGKVSIEKSVIGDIAKYSVEESKYVSFSHKLIQQNKGISVTYEDEVLTINLEVEVKFGNHVVGVIENLQQKIYQAITTSTGIEDVCVNVWVIGFTF